MSNPDVPTDWERKRFGDLAVTLRRAIPVALQAAHQRALESHRGLGLQTNHAYGQIWLAAPDELIKALEPLTAVRRVRPPRAQHDLPMVGENNVILYPWKFSDNAYSDLRTAKMNTPLSDLRQELLALIPVVDAQMTIDQAMMSEAELDAYYAELTAMIEEADSDSCTVIIAYASNPRSGILRIYWGDASGVDERGHVLWNHVEQIPLIDGEQAGGVELRPVGPASAPSRPQRFYEAELEDIELSIRPPLASPPEPERPIPRDETGSDD